MQKPKNYDWKDSNMALFGSDVEKKVKKESAESEKAWLGSGKKIGVEVWRINKFKVEKWPVEDYGRFFNGDSYIILNTYKEEESDELLMDVHFWIGKHSSQDEYGTAAYKTVELDTFHDDKPVQHREVQNHESELFKTYFDELTIMKGGCDSGFRRVNPEKHQNRLFQVRREGKKTSVKEIPMKRGNLNSDDVFIIDLGMQIYQYNGETCNKDEKFNATQYVYKLRSQRGGKPNLEIIDATDISEDHPVLMHLKDGKSKDKTPPTPGKKMMYAISDADGSLDLDLLEDGRLDRSKLNSDDVFLCDTGSSVFLYVGKSASVDERKNAMCYAHKYLMDKENPFMPVTVVSEGQKCPSFEAIFLDMI